MKKKKKLKKKTNKLYDPFLWMEFICLKNTKPPWGDSFLFTIKSPGVPGTYFINIERMKAESTLEPPTDFEPETPQLEIQHLKH